MDERERELKDKRICRFCLTQEEPLTNIHSIENRVQCKVPLPVQILACTSIEVFTNDSLPGTICESCRVLMDYCYRFKQVCNASDTKLKQYPLTGVWPEAMDVPRIPKQDQKKVSNSNKSPQKPSLHQQIKQQQQLEQNTVVKLVQKPPESRPLKRAQQIQAEIPLAKKIKTEENLVLIEINSDKTEPRIKNKPRVNRIKEKVIIMESDEEHEPVKILNSVLVPTYNSMNSKVREAYLKNPKLKTDEDGNVEIITEFSEILPDMEIEKIREAAPVETNVFSCKHCERSFPLKQLLEIHAVNHTRERDYKCDVCDKRFFSKYDLGKHTAIHTGIKPFECVVCNKKFSRSTLLHRHEKIHVDTPKYVCIDCERQFLSHEELKKHSQTHAKYRPFPCDICNKSFAFKQGLERHKLTHETKQPFPCEYCEKSFLTPNKLARHLTAHAGERPYPCKLCRKSFLLSHHLSRHIRSHSIGGENNSITYACNDCNKEFKTRDDLIFHSAEHVTNTLTCPLCKEEFRNSRDVTEHIKLHSTEEHHPCDYCDSIFLSLKKLENHCLIEHSEDHRGNEFFIENRHNSYEDKDASKEMDDNDYVIDEYVIEDVMEKSKKQVRIYNSKSNQSTANQNPSFPKILNKDTQSECKNDEDVEVLAEFEIRRSSRKNTSKDYAKMVKMELSDNEDEDDENNYEDDGCFEASSNNEDSCSFSKEYQNKKEKEDYSVKTIAKKSPEQPKKQQILNFNNKNQGSKKKTTESRIDTNPKSSQEKISKFLLKNSEIKQEKSQSATKKQENESVGIKTNKNEEVNKVLQNLPKGVTIVKNEMAPKPEIKNSQKTPDPVVKSKAEQQSNSRSSSTSSVSPTVKSSVSILPKLTPPTNKTNKTLVPQGNTFKPQKPMTLPSSNALKGSSTSPPQTLPTKSTTSKMSSVSQSNSKQIINSITKKTEKPLSIQITKPNAPAPAKVINSALAQLNIAKQLPNATYSEMKIGDRMVKVQKVKMTKTQVDEMEREGKIEMKDGKIILKNNNSNLGKQK